MEVVGVIPARLGSTRLPRKVLADVGGRPLLWHVWRSVQQSPAVGAVYVLTDAEEVRAAADGWGARVLLTDPACSSGTERIASALDRLPGDLFVNVQGDEPLLPAGLLESLVARSVQTGAEVVTPVYPIARRADLEDPNVVKVVRGADGQALYFSRAAIPYVRDVPAAYWLGRHRFWGHVGVYAYRRDVLAAYPGLPRSPLEEAERLEQLRLLGAGYGIHTVETADHLPAVDTAADLERVRSLLAGP